MLTLRRAWKMMRRTLALREVRFHNSCSNIDEDEEEKSETEVKEEDSDEDDDDEETQ